MNLRMQYKDEGKSLIMRTDKHTALKLRLQGMSYLEIQRALNIPKSTLSSWLSRVVLSPYAAERIQKRAAACSRAGLLRRNKNQSELALKRKLHRMSEAAKEIGSLSEREIFLIGVALYWAEGYKRVMKRNGRELTCHAVSLTNSDPSLAQCFMRFLQEVCKVSKERIRADIRIYEHLNEEKLIEFWSRALHLKREQFGKTYYGVSKSSKSKRPFNILPYGTIQIRVNSTDLFHRIIGWIEGVKREVEK